MVWEGEKHKGYAKWYIVMISDKVARQRHLKAFN